MSLQNNGKIALSQAYKSKAKYQLIESLGMEEHQVLQVYVVGVDIPLYLTTQVFQNKDGSEGMRHALSIDQ